MRMSKTTKKKDKAMHFFYRDLVPKNIRILYQKCLYIFVKMEMESHILNDVFNSLCSILSRTGMHSIAQ